MDAESGIFTAPAGGTYLFIFHIATHDNKKALLSIRDIHTQRPPNVGLGHLHPHLFESDVNSPYLQFWGNI